MAKKKWRKLSKLRPGALFVTKGGFTGIKIDRNGGSSGTISVAWAITGWVSDYFGSAKVRELDIEHLLVNSDDEDLLLLIEKARGEWDDDEDLEVPILGLPNAILTGGESTDVHVEVGGSSYNPRQSEPPITPDLPVAVDNGATPSGYIAMLEKHNKDLREEVDELRERAAMLYFFRQSLEQIAREAPPRSPAMNVATYALCFDSLNTPPTEGENDEQETNSTPLDGAEPTHCRCCQ